MSQAAVEADLRARLCNIYWEAGISKTDIALLVDDEVMANSLVASLLSHTLAHAAFAQMMAIFPEVLQD